MPEAITKRLVLSACETALPMNGKSYAVMFLRMLIFPSIFPNGFIRTAYITIPLKYLQHPKYITFWTSKH
jgi:hypothetical protein